MDPITTAIVAAVVSEVSKAVISNSYEVLKAALKKKCGSESDLVSAVNQLEKKPDSDARKAMLQEEVEAAKVNDDPEILQLAQDLLDKLKDEPGGQQIINQTQTNTASGNNVGGDFTFAPVQEGTKKA
ncbi:hypothetical protein NIES267_74720 (plasmid) [Calothrix parasitica NIES-267]|uniref:Uncharacterized protein n=1 Tax=Calothrix parasitica NIES-267 TaxID=1973488 RepID=A0A1Z4M3J0_9CYAN|nr:hypothetical protein NIES267_74720 [Calothrix parasitica NIES-267]